MCVVLAKAQRGHHLSKRMVANAMDARKREEGFSDRSKMCEGIAGISVERQKSSRSRQRQISSLQPPLMWSVARSYVLSLAAASAWHSTIRVRTGADMLHLRELQVLHCVCVFRERQGGCGKLACY